MFRTFQKKRTTKVGDHGSAVNRRVRAFQGDEEDEDHVVLLRRRPDPPAKRSRPNPSLSIQSSVPLSVREDSLDADEPSFAIREPKEQKRSKKSRTRGLGFGGSTVATEDSESDEEGATRYSRDVLSKLMQQQTETNINNQPITSVFDDDDGDTMDLPTLAPDTASFPSSFPEPEDYIPLSQVVGTTEILAGDEAMAFMEEPMDEIATEAGDRRFLSTTDGPDDQIDDHYWETEVVRRAGLQKASQSWTATNVHIDESRKDLKDWNVPPASDGPPVKAMEQLRFQISAAMDQIKDHQEELQRRFDRQDGALPAHQESGNQYERELRNFGAAHAFYQQWRNEYILWMGAMRELQGKVTMIQTSLHELERDKYSTQRCKEYDNDVVAILFENHVLEQVLGRQPTLPASMAKSPVEESPLVDEFGRNVISQASIQREKRRQRRRRLCEQRKHRFTVDSVGNDNIDTKSLSHQYLRGDESDGWNSDGEEENFRERHIALQNALSMALNEIDENYMTLHKMIVFFNEWYKAYPMDYRAACASQCFIDLATVLVQAELCSLNDPWNESGGYNESKWIVAMHRAVDAGICDVSSVERLFQRCIIPALSDILLNEGINLISSHQTRSMCTFLSHLQKLLPAGHTQWIDLGIHFTSHLMHSLDEMTIPILKMDAKIEQANVATQSKCEELDEAIFAATYGQLHRIKKMLTNVFLYWVPILPPSTELRTLLLHFISNKLIILLSSLNHLNRSDAVSETPSDIFQSIYQLLVRSGWLEEPNNMLVTATIRAAAKAYNIVQ
jgi:hypothetical protein